MIGAGLIRNFVGQVNTIKAAVLATLAGSGGAGLVGFMQLGVGAIARTLQAKGRDYIDVKDYGAVGDGVANDSAAITKAIAACCDAASGKMRWLHFPRGVYLVDANALNLPFFVQGGRFTGEGWYASVLRFNALGAPSFMFDNGATEAAQFLVFENLGFEGTTPANYQAGTIPANAGFMRQWSGGQTQGFKFLSCRISGFDKVLLCEGGNTASENHFVNCKITHIQRYVLALNNTQSLNHEFVSTDLENILGDVIQVQAGGGGGVKIVGGSIILSGAAACSLLRLAGAMASHGLTVHGARVELRNAATLAILPNSLLAKVTFSACSIYNTVAAGSRDIVSVGSFGTVEFHGCEFPSNGATSTYRLTGVAQFGESGRIVWDSCQVPSALSDSINFDSTFGRASAVNCHPMDYGAVGGEPFITAVDFDLGATGSYDIAGYKDAGTRIKRVWLKAAPTIWPKSNGAGGSANDLTIKLPKNALLKAVVLRKSAGGTSGAAYTLQVTNNDKTTTYASSNTDQQQNPHAVTVDNLFLPLGATDNGRIVRVSVTNASAGNQNQAGGFGYLEYV